MDDPLESDDRHSFATLTKRTPQREVRPDGHQLHINNASQKCHPLLPTHGRLHEDQIRENIDPIGSGSREILNESLCTGHSLPEFIGNGGDKGIFKPPIRASFHPHRPPCLELRPHPLRETQVGKFLRTIASTDTQLWAAQDSGVRVWNFSDAYEAGIGISGGACRRDEGGAPFYESVNTSPAMCLIVDSGSKLVWSGHTDGKIRSWKIDQRFDDTPFGEVFSWQAHSRPILSMVMTSYGDIWSGSEAGILKIWLREAIEKSLFLSAKERHLAALMVEGSAIDLRSQVTVNGVCRISSSDVKCLLSDYVRAKVWAAGSLSFSLWNARTKELLKVYNIDGQIENLFDVSSVQEQAIEDDTSVKFVSKSRKEKSQSCSFYQESLNAIVGAAGAVRQVAMKAKVAFLEGSKRTEALVMTVDGMIWSGSSNGLLVKWDGNGNRFQDFQHHPCAVQCFCTCGSRIWVGYMSGLVQVLDLEGNLIAGWVAHSSPVIKLVIGIGYVFSLSINGSIRGWNIMSPGRLDGILCSELARKELIYMRQDNVKILVGTWNVNQGRASHDSLMSWIGSAVSDVGIVVVGLQEMEMGVGFLAVSAAKETIGLEGSAIGRWWQDMIGRTLDEGSTFERAGSRQLAGLLIAIWVRKNLRAHVGDLDGAAVACGLGQVIGNKGGVGLRLRVYDRILCFVNCHFAAHLEAINRRNADFDHIYRTMVFSQSSKLICSLTRHLLLSCSLAFSMYLFWQLYSSGLPLVLSITAGVSSAIQILRCTNIQDVIPGEQKPELAEADMIIFLGDFNYRLLGVSYDEARDFIKQRNFDWLRERDQLRAEMTAGKVFQGMREGLIRFPPTYKFEKGKEGLEGYDSGKKKRIPAWCDRILYRDNRSDSAMGCSLECPVVSSILQYEACMDVTESDHKPVQCKFNVNIAYIDRSVRRQEFGKIVKSNDQFTSLFEDLCYVPEILVSTNSIILQNEDTSVIRITNKSGKDEAIFQIICEGQSTVKEDEEASYYHLRGSLGFPCWLEVMPAAGTIKPNQFVEVSVRHEDLRYPGELADLIPQSWSNDCDDKEVMLLVIVKGCHSSTTRSHQVRLRAASQARQATLIQEVAVSDSEVSYNHLASWPCPQRSLKRL